MNEQTAITAAGVSGYIDDKGMAWFKLEDVARGLEFTRRAPSGNEVVRWERLERYLMDIGQETGAVYGRDSFIPEKLFYRLAMKVKNKTADAFWTKVTNELRVWNYNAHEIRTVTGEGELWFIAKDVTHILNLDSSAVRRVPNTQKRLMKVMTNGGPQPMVVITKAGCDIMAIGCRKLEAVRLCAILKVKTISLRQEASCLLTITKAFVQLQMKVQYQVGPYRIDLYIPKYKLAVECDENDHIAYLGQDETARQTFIESALGCTFIRFNPDAQDFNIGTVINRMLMQMRMQDALQGATL